MVNIVDPRSMNDSRAIEAGLSPLLRRLAMRSFGVRLPILAATAWAGIGFSVLGMDFGYSETVYVRPTVATVVWPTSYVASRSYVLPTAYVSPRYLPTSYIEEPLILTSSYRLRRGLFGRLRLVERPAIASYGTIVPTAFYLPSYYTTSYRTRAYMTVSLYPTVYFTTVYEYPTVWETGYRARAGRNVATRSRGPRRQQPPRFKVTRHLRRAMRLRARTVAPGRSRASRWTTRPSRPMSIRPPAEEAKAQRNLPQGATKTQTPRVARTVRRLRRTRLANSRPHSRLRPTRAPKSATTPATAPKPQRRGAER